LENGQELYIFVNSIGCSVLKFQDSLIFLRYNVNSQYSGLIMFNNIRWLSRVQICI